MFREAGLLVLVLFSKESNLNSSERKWLTWSCGFDIWEPCLLLGITEYWSQEWILSVQISSRPHPAQLIHRASSWYLKLWRRGGEALQHFSRFSGELQDLLESLSLLTLRRNLTWQVADPSPPAWLSVSHPVNLTARIRVYISPNMKHLWHKTQLTF